MYLLHLMSIWIKNEIALFKPNFFGFWVKSQPLPTSDPFEEVQKTVIIPVLPTSFKDIIRQNAVVL